jgi:hypothetical protein
MDGQSGEITGNDEKDVWYMGMTEETYPQAASTRPTI